MNGSKIGRGKEREVNGALRKSRLLHQYPLLADKAIVNGGEIEETCAIVTGLYCSASNLVSLDLRLFRDALPHWTHSLCDMCSSH